MNDNVRTDRTKKLVLSAIMIAVGTVLSLIKLDLPFGGGLTFGSMFPLIIISYKYDIKWGVITAFTYSLIQMLLGIDNLQYATSIFILIAIVLLDYILPYSFLGLASITKTFKIRGIYAISFGILLTFMFRFVCHFLSGWLIWDNIFPNDLGLMAPIYSLLYNGSYMLGELIITGTFCIIFYPHIKRFISLE